MNRLYLRLPILPHPPTLLTLLAADSMTIGDVFKILGTIVTISSIAMAAYKIRASNNLQRKLQENQERKANNQRYTELEGKVTTLVAQMAALVQTVNTIAQLPSKLAALEQGQASLQNMFLQSQNRADQQFNAFMEYARRNAESSVDIARLVERDRAREQSITQISQDGKEIKSLLTEYVLQGGRSAAPPKA